MFRIQNQEGRDAAIAIFTAIIGLIASCIAIFTFVTGFPSVLGILYAPTPVIPTYTPIALPPTWTSTPPPLSPTYTPTLQPTFTSTPDNSGGTPDLESLQTQIVRLRAQSNDIQNQINTLNQQNTNSSQATEINKHITDIDNRLSAIEQVILDNPAKALSMPLINKDIANIQQRQEVDTQSLRDEINRVSSFNQWFLGILIPIGISVVSLAVRNFFVGSENKMEPQPAKDKTEPEIAKNVSSTRKKKTVNNDNDKDTPP